MRNPLRFLHVYDVSREHASCSCEFSETMSLGFVCCSWQQRLSDVKAKTLQGRRPASIALDLTYGLGNSNARVNGAMRTVWIKTRMAYLRDWTMDDSPLRQELLPRAIQPDFVVSIHIRSLSSNTYCILQLPESLEFSASSRCSQMHVKWVK